ncbi:MAG: c-type cytochrome [Sulfurospirillaceae bacterium]|jgi:thiosulfate dehydrogenase|nr:c-type cytochrome [Sulfurospirillaceae bacterium]MCK9546023.1 c-type cytochrome [Sulfurospirillaceae bacterium]MDY0237663.1 c-type cytochrome [Campylobacterales bacterium]NLM98849.1 c-type cytochrome [Campylobacteraceae bacterium]
MRQVASVVVAFSFLTTLAFAFEPWTLSERGDRGYKQPKIEWLDDVTINEVENGTINYAIPAFEGDPFWDPLNAKPIVPDTKYGEMVEYGYQLMVATWRHIGPEVEDKNMRYSGNNGACTNCHLGAGTFKYGAPFVGTFGHFPQYRNREDVLGDLTARINGCMERSMNGYKLPASSKEMMAMQTYMHWLSQGVPVGASKIEGRRLFKVDRKMVINNRADVENGRAVYESMCATCHGENGEGEKRFDANGKMDGYITPPLWGTDDTYNTGAGMYRTLKAADFIRNSMPKGSSAQGPILSDKEAYDVAAFINMDEHYRPIKYNRNVDFPDTRVRVPDQDVMGYYGEGGELTYPDEGKDRMDYKVGPYKGIIKQKPSN